MFGIEEFTKMADHLLALALALADVNDPSAEEYIVTRHDQHAWTGGRLLTAKREHRELNICIDDDTSTPDGFFKATGLDYERRLLRVVYPHTAVGKLAASELRQLALRETSPRNDICVQFPKCESGARLYLSLRAWQ